MVACTCKQKIYKADHVTKFLSKEHTLVQFLFKYHQEFKKKARAARIDSLYLRQDDGSYEVLADDR